MKKSFVTRKLITSIMVTVTLLYFMAKSPSLKIIFIPFLICGVAMIGKCIAQILDKEKLVFIFGKIFVLGFFLFFIGILAFAGYTSIRDKNYGLLVFLIPFCIIGIFMIKKKLPNKEQKENGESYSLIEMIKSFGLWIVIPVMMTVAGVFQVIKCLKNKNS